MDAKHSGPRPPEWLRASFWLGVGLELDRIDPHELALFEGAAGSAHRPTPFESKLWERLRRQL